MKFLAILQILCFLLLSSFTPMTSAAATRTVKSSCCEKMEKAGLCKQNKKNTPGNCGQGCSMLLTCGVCGFLPQQPVTLQPVSYATIGPQLPGYLIGNITGYATSDWKPPKV